MAAIRPSSVYSSSSSSVYSETPSLTPPPISNITNEPLMIQNTNAATIKIRRACLHRAPNSNVKNLAMIPIELMKSVRASRNRALSFPHYRNPVGPVSNLSGQPFSLYSTDFATIKTRRAVELKASIKSSANQVSFLGGFLAAFKRVVV
ncbi:hypothetical protein LTR78_002231 [Recurvomyces mirabilis]|uniref:Uncharacterized protein n=1 Tax=Recurvomyces mirabilis TaxID=574656 RepID=A0AAE0WUP3_9PEZI|nr:hypothetical protein LTR78_002231 [Recurvomyces mirabilis]